MRLQTWTGKPMYETPHDAKTPVTFTTRYVIAAESRWSDGKTMLHEIAAVEMRPWFFIRIGVRMLLGLNNRWPF